MGADIFGNIVKMIDKTFTGFYKAGYLLYFLIGLILLGLYLLLT
jgi:quinol-cytochrome oxidoreductase complex cytochrome b subunit